jgi:hypothetical protein
MTTEKPQRFCGPFVSRTSISYLLSSLKKDFSLERRLERHSDKETARAKVSKGRIPLSAAAPA